MLGPLGFVQFEFLPTSQLRAPAHAAAGVWLPGVGLAAQQRWAVPSVCVGTVSCGSRRCTCCVSLATSVACPSPPTSRGESNQYNGEQTGHSFAFSCLAARSARKWLRHVRRARAHPAKQTETDSNVPAPRGHRTATVESRSILGEWRSNHSVCSCARTTHTPWGTLVDELAKSRASEIMKCPQTCGGPHSLLTCLFHVPALGSGFGRIEEGLRKHGEATTDQARAALQPLFASYDKMQSRCVEKARRWC